MSVRRPIRRLAIANRGEVVHRVMRTAATMGIESVALATMAELDAPFVREADGVALLGTGYLDVEAVVSACVLAGADAVHPGYGFLSERPDFARAVTAAGLGWVGPPAEVMELLADKLAAKRLMASHGVPVLPEVELCGATLPAVLEFPVLTKAAAGGGGKGMHIVRSASDLPAAVVQARREAESAFGDGTVFLERYVPDARHIEVQILADDHGSVVHLFERECSLQRRHQKVAEESPSAGLAPGLRERITEAAVRAARIAGYRSAGTVEFVLAPDGDFWFLEVNARLQVEHPVTEAVTGVDLVREQLRVAQGLPLSVTQPRIVLTGHAVEARLYAENPAAGFLPATGTVVDWLPPDDPAVRWEVGIEAGSVIGVEYDPMIGKVIAHAPSREEAAGRLALALSRLRLRGVTTNRDFLVALLRHPDFLAGPVTTTFIERAEVAGCYLPDLANRRAAAIATALFEQVLARESDPMFGPGRSGLTLAPMPPQRRGYEVDGHEYVVEYRCRRDGTFDVAIGDWRAHADLHILRRDAATPLAASVTVRVGEELYLGHLLLHGDLAWFQTAEGDVRLRRLPRFPVVTTAAPPGTLVSPMPGSVIEVAVRPGDRVGAGDVLAVIEAMKMEHRLAAPHAGVVDAVRAEKGQQVRTGDPLVTVTADSLDRGIEAGEDQPVRVPH